LKELSEGHDNKIAEGTFGICVINVWHHRGYVVAVKQFKDKSGKADVEQEAKMISSFDHPGTAQY
jgi:hypothetical protein